MMNLKPFVTYREIARYKNVPIEYLDEVKTLLRKKGKNFRIRYRGPRNDPADLRPKDRRMQDCLKQFANRFSIYYR